MPMANKRTMTSEGTNNLAGLTDSLKSLTENTYQETVLSKSANTRLDSLSKSFGKDAKLQSKLVKLGRFEQVMDVASYMLSEKSQGLSNQEVLASENIIRQGKVFQENQKNTITEQEKSTNLESKTELHASINNDLLNRIHMVLVTRLDRILEGIQHMVPALDKSAIGPKDFQSAMEKMYSMSREGNKELKANIDDIRFRRADRKNKRELEAITYLRKQGKFAAAEAREKARNAKELELEGRNPDGSARRNPTQYHHWKGSDTDDTESAEKNPSWVSKMFRKMFRFGVKGASGMGILGLLKLGVPALFKLFKSLGKLFLKGGALGLLIYSVMPFLDTLKSKEFGTKWDQMKTRFISLKETFMPIFTKIDDFMTSIGESLGPWAAGAIITVGNGLITLLEGIGKLFSEDEDTKTKGWTQLKKFLLGENGEGGMIRSLGEFIIDMLDKTYEALLSSDLVKGLVKDLFTPDFSKIPDLADVFKNWIDGDKLFPEHGSKEWSINELKKSEYKKKDEKDDEYKKSELMKPQIVSKSPEGNNLWDSIMETLGVGAQITNVDNSVTHNTYSSSESNIANLAAEPPRDGKNRQAMADLNSMLAF